MTYFEGDEKIIIFRGFLIKNYNFLWSFVTGHGNLQVYMMETVSESITLSYISDGFTVRPKSFI